MKSKNSQMILTGFGIVASGILLYFFIDRNDQIAKYFARFLGILRPFIFGGCIAYLLRPCCKFFEKQLQKLLPGNLKKLSATIAIVLSMATGGMIIYLFAIAVVPQLISSITRLTRQIQNFMASGVIQKEIETFFDDNPQLVATLENWYNQGFDYLRKWINDGVLPYLKNLPGMFTEVSYGIASVFGVMMDLLVGIIVAVYLLKDRKKFARQGNLVLSGLLSPKNADLVREEIRFADKAFTGFLGGKVVDSAIIGMICYAFCIVAKIPNPMLISVIIGVTNIIPFFGPYIGAVPSAFLILVESRSAALIFIIFLVVLQQIDGNIIGPRILGNSTGLSSFWVLFAIMLFGGIWGVLGMIVGIPLFAVIYDIAKKFIIWRLGKYGKDDMLTAYNQEWHAGETTTVKKAEEENESTSADAVEADDDTSGEI